MADKRIILQPKTVVVEVQMRDGRIRKLECGTITRDIVARIVEASKGRNVEDILYEQIAIVFGGTKEDYFDIDDVRVAKQIVDFINEQIKNPV